MRAVAAWCLAGLLLLASGARASSERVPQVTVDGKPLPGLTAAVYEGQPHLALSTLSQLHATVIYDRARAAAAIGIGRRTLLIEAGSATALVDGQPYRGRSAPLIDRDEFWLPAEWLGVFALKVTWNEKASTLGLTWTRPFLLGARLDMSGAAPRLVIEATGAIVEEAFVLTRPDRLVFDLSGLAPYDYIALDERENEYFSGLRCGMNRPGIVRLVVDLRQPTGYRIDRSQAKDGRLVVELNTLVYGVAVLPSDGGKKLAATANVKPEFAVSTLGSPDRIVVEIAHASLAVPAGGGVGGKDDWYSGYEYRAVDPDRVQVVVRLVKLQGCEVVLARDRDNVIEVQPLRTLRPLDWFESADGFSLTSSGVLVIAASAAHYPERLILTLFHASAAAEESERDRGIVRHYRMSAAGPGMVEIVLDLRYEAPYTLEYTADRRQVAVRFQTSPLTGKAIVLDPGHGGEDTGALGRTAFILADGTKTTLREKDINLDVALRLKELLEAAEARVYLTRVDDTYVPLFSRASYANRLPAEMFISIHTNAAGDPAVHGVETFYYQDREEDRRLARLMLEEMVAVLGLVPRRGTANDLAVLRESQVLSVLVELGFLTNPAEEAQLATDGFRQRAAQALFRAIMRFVRGEAPDGG